MKKVSSSVFSLVCSGLLLSGHEYAQTFVVTNAVVMQIICWIALFASFETVKETALESRRWLWLNLPLSALSLYAMIVTGHPYLAASSFLFAFVFWCIAFSEKEARA